MAKKENMNITRLVKAFRTDENTVKVLYYHISRRQEFVVEWNNIDPATGDISSYDLQVECLSGSGDLNEIIENAISEGESWTEDCALYLEIRDTFDRLDCESI